MSAYSINYSSSKTQKEKIKGEKSKLSNAKHKIIDDNKNTKENSDDVEIPIESPDENNENDDDKESNDNGDIKNNDNNKDASFILRRNKKSGNYCILRKIKNNPDYNNSNTSSNDVQRVKYTAYSVYLPYGREEFNNSLILNANINDYLNCNYNLIVTFKKIIKAFTDLRDTDQGKYKYGINDKQFYNFMKEMNNNDKDDNDNDNESTNVTNNDNKNINRYQLRLYLRYGAKVTHSKHVGELNYNQLKGKRCNLDLELGALWVNSEIMKYGINIYVTRIVVLN
jgi:hypothetical protein